MRFTRVVDYGLRTLVYLAETGRATATDISRDTGIEVVTLSRLVLGELVKDRLLESKRGVHGGYWLRRRPDQISVLDVIEALVGELKIVDCVGCNHMGDCEIFRPLDAGNRAMEAVFKGWTIADIVRARAERGES